MALRRVAIRGEVTVATAPVTGESPLTVALGPGVAVAMGTMVRPGTGRATERVRRTGALTKALPDSATDGRPRPIHVGIATILPTRGTPNGAPTPQPLLVLRTGARVTANIMLKIDSYCLHRYKILRILVGGLLAFFKRPPKNKTKFRETVANAS